MVRHRLLLLSILFVACLLLLGRLTLVPQISHVDERLLTATNALSAEWLDTIMRGVTRLADWIVVLGIGTVATVYLAWRGRDQAAFVMAGSLVASLALNILLKGLFDRVRPDLWVPLVHEVSFSFPSGHATASTILGLLVIYVTWRTRWRVAAVLPAVAYILVIGFSRLYLGVHYPTDIVGGWLLSAAVISLMVYCSHARQNT